MNKILGNIVIFGRLGKDPELKYSKINQTPMCFLDVAEKNESDGKTIWHKVCVFGEQAQLCYTFLKTGVEFFVQGQKQSRTYTGKDGKISNTEEIKALRIGFSRL